MKPAYDRAIDDAAACAAISLVVFACNSGFWNWEGALGCALAPVIAAALSLLWSLISGAFSSGQPPKAQ